MGKRIKVNKGDVYWNYTLTGNTERRYNYQLYVEAICICGKITWVSQNALRDGTSKSCGCIKKKKEGECKRCGNMAREGKTECATCVEKYKGNSKKQWQRQKAREGCCYHCGEKSESTKCDACKKRTKDWDKVRIEKYRERGLCLKCGRDKDIKGTRCLKCLLQQSSRENTGTQNNYEYLLYLFNKQKGRCFYTGVKILFGENASIDHLYPISRFPEMANDLNNIVWCDFNVNKLKRALTYQEFIERCKNIINQVSALNGKGIQ